jgi:hypothetical protein
VKKKLTDKQKLWRLRRDLKDARANLKQYAEAVARNQERDAELRAVTQRSHQQQLEAEGARAIAAHEKKKEIDARRISGFPFEGGDNSQPLAVIAESLTSLVPESIRGLERSNAEFMAGYGIQADTKDDDGQVH